MLNMHAMPVPSFNFNLYIIIVEIVVMEAPFTANPDCVTCILLVLFF